MLRAPLRTSRKELMDRDGWECVKRPLLCRPGHAQRGGCSCGGVGGPSCPCNPFYGATITVIWLGAFGCWQDCNEASHDAVCINIYMLCLPCLPVGLFRQCTAGCRTSRCASCTCATCTHVFVCVCACTCACILVCICSLIWAGRQCVCVNTGTLGTQKHLCVYACTGLPTCRHGLQQAKQAGEQCACRWEGCYSGHGSWRLPLPVYLWANWAQASSIGKRGACVLNDRA